MNACTVIVRKVIVVTVNTVRSGRVRRFEVPSDTAANLALRRPDSRIVLPMAKMTEARSKAYADELTLKAGAYPCRGGRTRDAWLRRSGRNW